MLGTPITWLVLQLDAVVSTGICKHALAHLHVWYVHTCVHHVCTLVCMIVCQKKMCYIAQYIKLYGFSNMSKAPLLITHTIYTHAMYIQTIKYRNPRMFLVFRVESPIMGLISSQKKNKSLEVCISLANLAII
jgi:succinate-acetate transporter protein